MNHKKKTPITTPTTTTIFLGCDSIEINLVMGSKIQQKKWDSFYGQYPHQLKHKSAGYILHLKGGIHISDRSTKRCLYDIRELRYKQIKMDI